MNKQEVIDELKTERTVRMTMFGAEVEVVPTEAAVNLIDQLDEPQKVVVPKFVAEWIECARKEHLSLNQAMNYYLRPDEVEKWLQYAVNQNLFARAWLDGYEVEQEKLYTVEIPNPNETDLIVVLRKWEGCALIDRCVGSYDWRKDSRFHLTESEIRKDFDWAWQWAEEVKEVE